MSSFALTAEFKANTANFISGTRQMRDELGRLATGAGSAQGALGGLKGRLDEMASGIDGKIIKSIGAAVAGFATLDAAIGAVAAAIRTGITEIEEWEAATAKLTAVFDGNAEAMGRMLGLVGQLNASQPFFEDDQLANAAATLKLFNATEQQITTLLPVLTNMAAVMGVDVDDAAQRVGMALAGATRGLKGFGIVVKEGATDQEILNAVLDKGALFADAARIKAGGLEGQIGQLNKTTKDAAATLTTKMQPALTAMIALADAATKGFADMVGAMLDVAGIKIPAPRPRTPAEATSGTRFELGGELAGFNRRYQAGRPGARPAAAPRANAAQASSRANRSTGRVELSDSLKLDGAGLSAGQDYGAHIRTSAIQQSRDEERQLADDREEWEKQIGMTRLDLAKQAVNVLSQFMGDSRGGPGSALSTVGQFMGKLVEDKNPMLAFGFETVGNLLGGAANDAMRKSQVAAAQVEAKTQAMSGSRSSIDQQIRDAGMRIAVGSGTMTSRDAALSKIDDDINRQIEEQRKVAGSDQTAQQALADNVAALNRLRDLLKQQVEMQQQQGTEAKPLIVAPPRGARFERDRGIYLRATAPRTQRAMPNGGGLPGVSRSGSGG